MTWVTWREPTKYVYYRTINQRNALQQWKIAKPILTCQNEIYRQYRSPVIVFSKKKSKAAIQKFSNYFFYDFLFRSANQSAFENWILQKYTRLGVKQKETPAGYIYNSNNIDWIGKPGWFLIFESGTCVRRAVGNRDCSKVICVSVN